ncbi:hypothetical protein T484DRAFT_1626065, partial [Baffinella frigidus]
RNPKPETRNPKPETPKQKPENRKPKPKIRNRNPETRNPKPEPQNPKKQPRHTLSSKPTFFCRLQMGACSSPVQLSRDRRPFPPDFWGKFRLEFIAMDKILVQIDGLYP